MVYWSCQSVILYWPPYGNLAQILLREVGKNLWELRREHLR